jgi:hypothetical protein
MGIGAKKNAGGYPAFRKNSDSPAGSYFYHRTLASHFEIMKKGAGASPLFLELTPQNQNPSRGWVPATPGSQSCLLTGIEQTVCQRWTQMSDRIRPMKRWDLVIGTNIKVNFSLVRIYKISQENRCYIHSLGDLPRISPATALGTRSLNSFASARSV